MGSLGEATGSDGTVYHPFNSAKFFAVGNVTEFRIYGKDKEPFQGFYWGPYFTYTYYKLTSGTYPGQFQDNAG